MKRALVTGAGGFIGGHLVAYLKARGYFVRGVDIKPHEFRSTVADEFLLCDLRDTHDVERAFKQSSWRASSVGDWDELYMLAADMGGMGFISQHHAAILDNNLRININTVAAAQRHRVGRVFFSSSACVYPEYRQMAPDALALAEWMAYPAQPQDAYGWEKLTAERLLQHYHADHGLEVRIARFHNVYGPYGTWQGGREKAPAALCRKVAEAARNGSHVIDIWGDGEQTRSFMYVDDCVEGVYRLMQSNYSEPLNIGSDHMVSINQLAGIIGKVAGLPSVHLRHVDGPQGVRGRNSDNGLCWQVLEWRPTVSLEDGIASTYAWIEQQVYEADHVIS